MKKIILLVLAGFVVSFAQDSTAVLEPSKEYIELTNNKYDDDDSGIRSIFAPDSNGAFSPKKAMLFSMIMPGLGHLYVRKPIKGLVYFAIEAYHVQQAIYFHNQYINDVKPNVKLLKEMIGEDEWWDMGGYERTEMLRDSTDYNLNKGYWRPEEQRNKRIWWCAGFYIITMLDCYVDAHLSDFPKGDLEFINDTKIKSNGLRLSIPIEGTKNE